MEGDKGHLDNKVTARFVADMWNPELKFVFLNHLSNDNNTPEIALHETRSALEAKGATVGDASYAPDQANCDVQLYALPLFCDLTIANIQNKYRNPQNYEKNNVK